MGKSEEHLRLLAIFHYVVGGLVALFACFPIIHLVIGIVFILAPARSGSRRDVPPALFGWFFVAFASVMILAGWTLAVLVVTAGRFLARRRHYTFCVIVAGIECAFMPFGTVLGVFTIIVLMREGAKEIFSAEGTDEGRLR
jgi:hypothetical protein